MTLMIDGRWDGNYGIGRVGREVRSRLVADHTYRSSSDPLSPRGILELWMCLRKAKPTIFWSAGFTGTVPGTGVRQVLTVWDLVHLEESHRTTSKSLYYAAVVKPAILQSGAVMTGTEYGAAQLRDWLGPTNASVSVYPIGCGVSEAFKPTAGVIDLNHFVLVGSLQPHKNVDVALRAAGRIGDVEVTWVVNDREGAMRHLRSIGADSRVTVVADISDPELAELYGRSAALLFPSVSEGFGLPPVEANACGTPVIYFKGCISVAETCANDKANIAVPSANSVDDWVTAMQQARGCRMSPKSSGTYTWSSVARRVASALSELHAV